MKKAIIILTLGFFALPQAGWELVTEYNGYIDLNSVFFSDALHGWVIGADNTSSSQKGYIAYSQDGGTTWQHISSALSGGLIHFVDNNRGFATNSNEYLFKTNDGGLTWNAVTIRDANGNVLTSGGLVAYGITFTSPDTAYAYAWVRVYKTVDGGENWVECLNNVSANRGNGYYGSFINSYIGWHVHTKSDSHGYINKTVDGGDSWTADSFYVSDNGDKKRFPALRSIAFTNENNGYVWGDSGFFARTTNGGETWDLRSFDNSYGAIKKILFVNSTAGWILAENKLAMTLDGGTTWEEVSITGANIKTCTDIFFSDANHGWLIGGGNRVLRTTDNGGYPQPVSVKPSARSRQQPSAAAFSIRQLSGQKNRAKIAYKLNQDVTLSMVVYNLKGARTAFTPKRQQSAGEYEFSFAAPKGFYIIEAKVQGKTGETKFAERILVR